MIYIKKIFESVVYINTASKMWLELEERFRQLNNPLLFQVQKALSQICQGTNNIISYFTRIKKLWDKIEALSRLPQCSCGVLLEMLKIIKN